MRFKNILLSLMLSSCLISPCLAKGENWVLLNDEDEYSIYYDPKSIVVKGNIVSIWSIINLKEKIHSWVSAKNRYVFYCDQNKGDMDKTLYYSAHMATGKLLETTNSDEIYLIIPDTASADLYKYACAKSKSLIYRVPEL
jgi:hypothetical protein